VNQVDDIRADWIAVDWGTTNLRAWAMSRDGEALAEATSRNGMGALDKAGFEPALIEVVGGWLGEGVTPVVACGMVGSRQGWVEAPYMSVPCTPSPECSGMAIAQTLDPRLDVQVIPGLCQSSPADVMRGEETQIAGFLSLNPGWDGVMCLPGTHTKWVHISAGEVVSFQTFMTGELFATLTGHTVLRHTVGQDGWDETLFLTALDDALSRPEAMAARLFSLRAESLLSGLGPAAARARLSGLLLGSELAASRPYWLGQQVGIVGADGLSRAYATALERQGVAVTLADATAMTLAGLRAAAKRIKERTQ